MSRFADEFSEPVSMSEDCWALSAEAFPTEAEAWAEFLGWAGGTFTRENYVVERDRVRFRPTSEDEAGDFDVGQRVWWCGASAKRGSKPVWLFVPNEYSLLRRRRRGEAG